MLSPSHALCRLALIVAACLGFGALAADDRESLFGDDLPPMKNKADVEVEGKTESSAPGIRGFLQFELARTTASTEHWSKMRTRADLSSQGRLNDSVKWKLGVRMDYDAVYDVDNFYPQAVRNNQRAAFEFRENYLDISAGGWDFRLGRQHVVWGEMVGLFFADVVSARDLREFILPEFDQMRTPQWAARAEYFGDDIHGELLWIPVASYDNIGKPGADFYPYQPVSPGFTVVPFAGSTDLMILINGRFWSCVVSLDAVSAIPGFSGVPPPLPTYAMFVISRVAGLPIGMASTFPCHVTVTVDPAATAGSTHRIVPELSTPLLLADPLTYISPAGTVSATGTFTAPAPPSLRIASVYVITSPVRTVDPSAGSAVL